MVLSEDRGANLLSPHTLHLTFFFGDGPSVVSESCLHTFIFLILIIGWILDSSSRQ